MDFKWALVLIALLAFMGTVVDADIYFDREAPTFNDTEKWGYKCIPGRSYIKIGGDKPKNDTSGEDDTSEEDGRRTHMNSGIKEEECIICLCSVDGKEKHCVGRPARNVNECIRMNTLTAEMQKGIPYSHDRILAYRVRRDYIWHYDEIPYDAKAKCKRGVTYYSNNVNANDTDIDVGSDVESLLSYNTTDICFYCVCSVDGKYSGCIKRDPWYCEYYRMLRDPSYNRKRYAHYFRQDRPAYFRSLSYRMRRKMDDVLYDLLDVVGTDSKCVPLVSEYSDCSDDNLCSGCNKCTCNKDGDWLCRKIVECPVDGEGEEEEEDDDQVTIDVSLQNLVEELQDQKKNRLLAPLPAKSSEDLILGRKPEDLFLYTTRKKRSLDNNDTIHTIKFYNTVDEINEDTLKNSSQIGTVKANKFVAEAVPKSSRRNSPQKKESKTNTALNSLHIEPNQLQELNHHSAENKIDSVDEKKVAALDKNMLKMFGNYSQDKKNTDLSKVVANELKSGVEILGDKNVSPVSNITFTPENDTLTAMAFIAGNLLNKLWDMQKYADLGSIEADKLKHEKINDLLDLFKEPLSIRQETFLKNALDKLSQSLDRNKNVRNMTICENLEDIVGDDKIINNITTEKTKPCVEDTAPSMANLHPSLNMTAIALSKLNNVLNLINDFEDVQKNIDRIKAKPQATQHPKNDSSSTDTLQTFGNILNKISKLLIPSHSNPSKHRINHLRYLGAQNDIESNKKHVPLNDLNMTVKDKLVLDYINHIENNPGCLYKNNPRTQTNNSLFEVGGNILQFLSQFMNNESFDDLLKPLNLAVKKQIFNENITSTEKIVLNKDERPKYLHTNTTIKEISPKKERSKFQIAKEKLKSHLKDIIDDLIDLQGEDEDGRDLKKINIAQALPCIYNILNDKGILHNKSNKSKATSLNKIKSLIDSIKLDFQTKKVTRRKFTPSVVISQSAKVFERIIKNINSKLKQNTRRSFNTIKPKTYEQIKNMINTIENNANSYKNFAVYSHVPHKHRLMLLKTLEADVKQHERVLSSIQSSIDIISNLPTDKRLEIEEFVENSKTNIDLSEKVIQSVLENKVSKKETMIEEFKNVKKGNVGNNKLQVAEPPHDKRKEKIDFQDTDLKVTKDKIINQLMINRVNAYLQLKDAEESPSDDMKYNIATNILSQIKSGNTALAKELFKIFLSSKDIESLEKPTDILHGEQKRFKLQPNRRKGSLILALKDPLIAIQPKSTGNQAQDSLLKQLLNLESI